MFSHSRILQFALSKVRSNSSDQGVRLEGEAPRGYNLEQTAALGHLRIWDTLGFAAEQVCSNRYHWSPGMAALDNRGNGSCCILHQILRWTRPQSGSFFRYILYMYLFTPANFYPSKSLWFRGKCAFRHLRAIKSVSVIKCGNFNYQKGENQGLVVKSKPLWALWDGAAWHGTSSQGTLPPSSLLPPQPPV